MCPPPSAFLFESRSHIVQAGLQLALQEAKNEFKFTILLPLRPSHAGTAGTCPMPSLVLTQGLYFVSHAGFQLPMFLKMTLFFFSF